MERCSFFLSAACVATGAHGQTVKITPLRSHAGEFCATDCAMLFEDPTGVRLVYDVGASVAGAGDPRLGDVHVILLSHAHGDHIGLNKAAGLNAGICAKPETVSALPATTTGEIAAAKNAAIMTGIDMTAFVAKKVEAIHGKPVENCAETGLTRDTIVPLQAPCGGHPLAFQRWRHRGRQAQGRQSHRGFRQAGQGAQGAPVAQRPHHGVRRQGEVRGRVLTAREGVGPQGCRN